MSLLGTFTNSRTNPSCIFTSSTSLTLDYQYIGIFLFLFGSWLYVFPFLSSSRSSSLLGYHQQALLRKWFTCMQRPYAPWWTRLFCTASLMPRLKTWWMERYGVQNTGTSWISTIILMGGFPLQLLLFYFSPLYPSVITPPRWYLKAL